MEALDLIPKRCGGESSEGPATSRCASRGGAGASTGLAEAAGKLGSGGGGKASTTELSVAEKARGCACGGSTLALRCVHDG
jgi:hypothetical protein